MKIHKVSKKGFTIIEVVLVLAIAGLIFLMVFVALPNLQKNQRDIQRRNTVSAVYSAVMQYRTNNGKLPFNYGLTTYHYENDKDGNRVKVFDEDNRFDTTFITDYVDSTCSLKSSDRSQWGDSHFYYENCSEAFADPNGRSYSLTVKNGNSDYYIPSEGIVYSILVAAGNSCNFVNGTPDDNGGYEMTRSGAPNAYIVVMRLEGGGLYCLDNG